MRHGEVDYFDADGRPFHPAGVPLTAAGRRQVEAAALALAGVPLDRAITSGLERASATAALVLAGRSVPLEADPCWREIETGRFSDWAGATPQQVERAILGALPADLQPADRFLGGETFASLQSRVEAAWAEVLARRDWQHLLIVAHGVVNRLLLCALLGGGLGGLGALEQDAGCINLIEVREGRHCLVRLVNHTPADCLKGGMPLSTIEGLYSQYLRGREKVSGPLSGGKGS
jgi:probable phosphoglycerate mutase